MNDDSEIPIHSHVVTGGDYDSNQNNEWLGVIFTRNVYTKYGEYTVVRPYFFMMDRPRESKYCDSSLIPLKVNNQWIKFTSTCNDGLMGLFPYTLDDANKLKSEFTYNNFVIFEGYKISAKGFTKLDKRLNKMYSPQL